jgi:hypothetical protein
MENVTITKYGIKTDLNGFVVDIGYWNNNPIPNEYLEISEYQYFQFIETIKPYSKFDGNNLIVNQQDETNYIAEQNKIKLREQMRDLSIEIGLNQMLGEDMTEKQTELNSIKSQYETLTNPQV